MTGYAEGQVVKGKQPPIECPHGFYWRKTMGLDEFKLYAKKERKAARASGRPVDPEAEARRERGRQLRAIAEQAHGANLDLGWGLMNGLAAVDPADMAVVI